VNFVGNPAAKPIKISTILANSDGLYPRFTVTYEGVDVGSVSEVELVPKGVKVTMTLQPGTRLPANLGVRIGLANDLGEQQIDLVRIGPPKGVLHTGTVLPKVANGTPVEVGKVVALASKLLQAIPPSDLNELLNQSALALQGEGPNLRTILVSGELFAREVLHYRQEIDALLSNSPSVLNTIASLAAPLHQALANTAALLSVVEAQSHQITSLFQEGTNLARSGTTLLDNEGLEHGVSRPRSRQGIPEPLGTRELLHHGPGARLGAQLDLDTSTHRATRSCPCADQQRQAYPGLLDAHGAPDTASIAASGVLLQASPPPTRETWGRMYHGLWQRRGKSHPAQLLLVIAGGFGHCPVTEGFLRGTKTLKARRRLQMTTNVTEEAPEGAASRPFDTSAPFDASRKTRKGVVNVDQDDARIVDQTYANDTSKTANADVLRVVLGLTSTPAGWRISEVTVLSAGSSAGTL
jgi:virulence factor Mce-like protein